MAGSDVLTIKFIREGGPFDKTVPGLDVVSVNGVAATGKTPKEAVEILREAEGDVDVVAKGVAAKVTKSSKDTKCGISIQRDRDIDEIMVTNVKEGGLFEGTGIKAGDKALTINGTPCPKSTKEAINLIREAEGEVTVVAISMGESTDETPAEPAGEKEEAEDAPAEKAEKPEPAQEPSGEDPAEQEPV